MKASQIKREMKNGKAIAVQVNGIWISVVAVSRHNKTHDFIALHKHAGLYARRSESLKAKVRE